MKRLIITLAILVSGLIGLGYYLNKTEANKVETTEEVVKDSFYIHPLDEELCNALVKHYTGRYHLYHTAAVKNESGISEYFKDCYITNYMFTSALVIDEDKENDCIRVKHTFIADKYDLITKQTYKDHPFTDTLTIRFTESDKNKCWILSDWN